MDFPKAVWKFCRIITDSIISQISLMAQQSASSCNVCVIAHIYQVSMTGIYSHIISHKNIFANMTADFPHHPRPEFSGFKWRQQPGIHKELQ